MRNTRNVTIIINSLNFSKTSSLSSRQTIDLSIVIPAYREEKRIGKTLDQLALYINTSAYLQKINVEVIVVSADSADKTHKIVTEKSKDFSNFIFIKPGSRVGKGRDVKAGVLAAGGAAVLFMDADLATPLWHIEQFYQIYQKGADVVVATRGIHRDQNDLGRAILSTMGNFLYRIAGGIWIEDSQCGFKLFSAQAADACFQKLTILGWGFDMEVLAAAKANCLTIQAVHIDDWKAIPGGSFEDSIARNVLHALVDLFVIFSRRISGQYKTMVKKRDMVRGTNRAV
jgi:dolichyl-phosphate beta-glucosyltransferase